MENKTKVWILVVSKCATCDHVFQVEWYTLVRVKVYLSRSQFKRCTACKMTLVSASSWLLFDAGISSSELAKSEKTFSSSNKKWLTFVIHEYIFTFLWWCIQKLVQLNGFYYPHFSKKTERFLVSLTDLVIIFSKVPLFSLSLFLML